ncbi:MAG TPA: prepilin-type N-terminal cleavage/methylation domain-containing protein [Solirubrobacteraceae bacterium]
MLGLRDEHGFTLVEMLVSIFAGLIVIFAAFAILDISLHQSSRIADRVSADQRGRLAMEKIVLKLHSSCVAAETTPVEAGSEANKLLIVSQTGAEASFAKVTLHEIVFSGEKLTDTSYLNTEKKPAPNWEFSGTPLGTQTLLTHVTRAKNSKGEEIPIFQYYKYEGSTLSAPLAVPLNATEANATAAIAVNFTAAPESGNVGKITNDRTFDLSDTAVLRFSPASSSGTNIPCA